jgi:hypothetical protein
MALFNEDGTYTEEASHIDREVSRVLAPFFKIPDRSTREMLAIITSAAVTQMAGEQIMRGMLRWKARQAAEQAVVNVDMQHE